MTTTPARAGRAVELLARADELDRDARNFNLLTGERERAAARAGRAAVLAIGHALVAALPDETADALAVERDAARTELGRVDQKAGVALSAAGLLLSAVAAVAALGRPHLATVGMLGLWGALAILAASCAVLLLVIRPSLPRPGAGTGVMAYATQDGPAAVLAALDGPARERLAADLHQLAAIARTKYRRLRLGIDLMLAALALLAIAVPLGA
ncbi:Pycsar system effector family protein [Microbispora sp. CA-102843]|uniref:Pycsar system effector family protein n=1 Tax=Microbispora sp. CA-102843 TaxID=3239952 RepID=UPI003D8AEEFE